MVNDGAIPAATTDQKGVAKFEFEMPEKNDLGTAIGEGRVTFFFLAKGMDEPAPKVVDVQK